MNEWISVEDRLPEYGKRVFMYRPRWSGRPVLEGLLLRTDHAGRVWQDCEGFTMSGINTVTHWMPLPEPPEATV